MAENTPIGTATSADSTIAIAPSWNVTGSRWRSASEISRLLKKDSPKSPRSTSPTHWMYCLGRLPVRLKRSSSTAR